jgi:hypothetical protein
MGTRVSFLLWWKHVKRISRSTSNIENNWTITRQGKEKQINSQENIKTKIHLNKQTLTYTVNMSTSTSTQNVLTVIKDEFAEVLTEGTLSPINEPADWNVITTKKALLEVAKMPSPPPEEVWHGLATQYDNTFSTHKEYREFAANHLAQWGNTLDYKLFDTLYLTHWYHVHTIKNLREQAKALLEEANKINERDKMVRHEIETHVQTITRSDLWQRIEKPQWVRVVVSPTRLPSSSRQPDYSHLATYGRNYARRQYQCLECGDPTHFKCNCPFYRCRTCGGTAPGHAPRACHGHIHDDGIRGHYNIDGYKDGNLTGEC